MDRSPRGAHVDLTARRPPTRTLAIVGAVALVVLVGAIVLGVRGHKDTPTATATNEPKISAATQRCRDDWSALGKSVRTKAALTEPSALPQRWNSVVATSEYYATSASAKTCQRTLTEQRDEIALLADFSTRLQKFDMVHQLARVRDVATSYADSKPPAEKKTNKKNKKPKNTLPAPQVAQALTTLQQSAPVARSEMDPGWQEADSADLSDPRAVKQVLDDLQFLSTDSPAFVRCQQALAVIGKVPGLPAA